MENRILDAVAAKMPLDSVFMGLLCTFQTAFIVTERCAKKFRFYDYDGVYFLFLAVLG